MKPKTKKKPTPDELLAEVQGQGAAKTYEFEDYLPVIHAMKEKGHSYAGMADFLKDRLGITASRGQVYRAYQIWLEETRLAEEGMEEQERFAPPETFQDEYDEKLYQNAIQLIDSQREQNRDDPQAPWDDADSIILRAARILTEKREAEAAADEAAAAADNQLEAKKGAKNASAK